MGGGEVIGLAVDIQAGEMRFSQNGEWFESMLQQADFGGQSIFPAVSMRGFFAMHFSRGSWAHAPPDESYEAWSDSGVLCRPPPPLDDDVAVVPASLERMTSHVHVGEACEGEELSASNLPAFAKAVTQKTLVTN